MKTIKKISLIFWSITILLLSIFSLVSCNKEKDYGDGEYSLFLNSLVFDSNTKTITATVGINQGTEGKVLDGIKVSYKTVSEDVDVFYIKYINYLSYNDETIYSAIKNGLTQEQWDLAGGSDSTLKVNFTYATIYKSTQSSGEISKSGKYYYHTFNVDSESTDKTIVFERVAPYQPTWYGVLLGIAGFIMIIIVAVVLIRGKHGKERRN